MVNPAGPLVHLVWWQPPLGLEEWAGTQRTLARQAEAGDWQVTLPGAEK